MTLCSATLALGASLTVLLLVAWPAWGQELLPVDIQSTSCDPLDIAELKRLIALELDLQLTASPPQGAERIFVRLTCNAKRVTIAVDDPLTQKTLTRTLARSTARQERLLALAIVELLDVSWTELVLQPKPSTPTPPTSIPDNQVNEALRAKARSRAEDRVSAHTQSDASHWRLDIAALGRVAPGPNRINLGVAAAAAIDLATLPIALGFDAQWIAERTHIEAGQVDATLVSLAPLALATFHRHPIRCVAGGGVRLGLVAYSGDASDGVDQRITLPWAGPVAVAGLTLDWPWPSVLTLHMEAGHALVEAAALADGEPTLAVEGQWVAVRLGSGWRF